MILGLNQWATRHQVPAAALGDLLALLGVGEMAPVVDRVGVSEAAEQQRIRLEASRAGVRLWRNNNGATFDEHERLIRYGLANDSKQMSMALKSSDLIGVTPYPVSQADVGRTLGVFTSIEVKRPGWKYHGTGREVAQLAWINLITSLGGIAKFAAGQGDWKWW